MKVLMTGASGLIGKEIGKLLAEQGHSILVVSRDQKKARLELPFPCEVIEGDLNKQSLKDPRLKDVEGVINLMGETISGRWTAQKKKAINDSRIIGTRNLVQSLPSTLKVFVGGSAIGAYGSRRDEILSEESPLGDDFLAKVCQDWEQESQKAPGRHVAIRTGVVMAQQGGAFPQMLLPFKIGVGGKLGNGQQWMSWVHINDIARLFVFALENETCRGPINGSAPHPVTNKELSQKLAQQLSTHMGPPVPAFALKMLFAEGADPILGSQRATSRAQELGFNFHYQTIDAVLEELCEPYREGDELLVSEQYFSETPEKLFAYFKEAKNLEDITPPTLKFQIEKVSTAEIAQGTLIDYNLKVHGVPMKWKTEIDRWDPPHMFVDNQLSGPYRKWHHTHEFKPFAGGTLMTDRVRYRLPLGYFGWAVAGAFVRKDVQKIFDYRRKVISSQSF